MQPLCNLEWQAYHILVWQRQSRGGPAHLLAVRGDDAQVIGLHAGPPPGVGLREEPLDQLAQRGRLLRVEVARRLALAHLRATQPERARTFRNAAVTSFNCT